MKIQSIPTEALIPYARNARTHTPEQIAQVAASIREFGFLNPVIVDGDNGIIAGHCRVLAARKLGLVSVPCVRAMHLTDVQKRAYILADNRLALDAGWDEEALRIEIEGLLEVDFDTALLGFSDAELHDAIDGIQVAGGHGQPRLDTKAPTVCPNCGHEFIL